jgi:hypothetical protein
MYATLTIFYLIQKIKQGFFLYYIPCKEKIKVGQNLKFRLNCCLSFLPIHILKLDISGCDRVPVLAMPTIYSLTGTPVDGENPST